jgi:hypothetical protein
MISLILAILYSDLLQKHLLRGILVTSSCGSDSVSEVQKVWVDILLLIGGVTTGLGGIVMILSTWWAPLLGAIVASFVAIVWGILAAVTYWL